MIYFQFSKISVLMGIFKYRAHFFELQGFLLFQVFDILHYNYIFYKFFPCSSFVHVITVPVMSVQCNLRSWLVLVGQFVRFASCFVAWCIFCSYNKSQSHGCHHKYFSLTLLIFTHRDMFFQKCLMKTFILFSKLLMRLLSFTALFSSPCLFGYWLLLVTPYIPLNLLQWWLFPPNIYLSSLGHQIVRYILRNFLTNSFSSLVFIS